MVFLTVRLVLPVNAFRALRTPGLCGLDDLAWSALEPLHLAGCVLDVSRHGGEPVTPQQVATMLEPGAPR